MLTSKRREANLKIDHDCEAGKLPVTADCEESPEDQ